MQPHGHPPFSPPPTLSQAESRVFELQSPPSQVSPTFNPAGVPPPPRDQHLPTSEQQLAHDHAIRQRRLGRACDACSKRKVKCGDVVPCRNCISLGVECTFARPAKRRGPANRVAEDLKRARFEVNDLNSAPGLGSTGGFSATAGTMSGVVDAAALQNAGVVPMGMPPSAGLDSLAPAQTVSRMVYDFYTYVYPMFPFPHEHILLDRLRKREDMQNRSFCALVAALLATLASVFPLVAQGSLNELEQNGQILATDVFVGRCMLLCEQSRGPLTSARDVDDAATGFFLGLVSYTRRQLRLVDMYWSETMSIVKYLGVEEGAVLADNLPADHVTTELCRRIYWTVYNLDRLHHGTGRSVITPFRKTTELPPLPLATDDYYIYIDRIQPQPQGQLSTLDAFNLTSHIYLTIQPLLHFGLLSDESRSWESTQSQISSHIVTASKDLENIISTGHPELVSLPNPSVFDTDDSSPQHRMHLRWEIQKIMLRLAIVVVQVYMAEMLAAQTTDENKENLRLLAGKCVRDAGELVESVTVESLRPVMRIVEGPFGWVVGQLRRIGTAVGEGAGLDELARRSEELLRA